MQSNVDAYTVADLKNKIIHNEGLREDEFGLVHGGIDITKNFPSSSPVKSLLEHFQLTDKVELYLEWYKRPSMVIYLTDRHYLKRICQRVAPCTTCREIGQLLCKLKLTSCAPQADFECFLFDGTARVMKVKSNASIENILPEKQKDKKPYLVFFFTDDGHLRIWTDSFNRS